MSSSKPSWWDETRYGGLDSTERNRQVQRDILLWEQKEELKKQSEELNKQNELIKEKMVTDRNIEREKENNKKQEEFDRYWNEINLEHEKHMNKMEMERLRQSHEELMRFYNLCDKMNLNYDDLVKLNVWLTNLTKEQKEEYLKSISKVNSIISEEDIKKLEDDYSKIEEILIKYKNNIEELNNKELYDNIILQYKEAKSILKADNYLNYPNAKKFFEFRLNHYNSQIEMLFRKLNIQVQLINKDEVKNKGSIDDYNDFIVQILPEVEKILKNKNNENNKLSPKEEELVKEYLFPAIKAIIESGNVSTSFLQRKFNLKYTQACILIDEMENRGMISKYNYDIPREVLITKEKLNELMKNNE